MFAAKPGDLEFDSQDMPAGRRELALSSYPFASTRTPWAHLHMRACTQYAKQTSVIIFFLKKDEARLTLCPCQSLCASLSDPLWSHSGHTSSNYEVAVHLNSFLRSLSLGTALHLPLGFQYRGPFLSVSSLFCF